MLGRRERRVERWALIRCLRLLSASLWLLHVSDLEAELTIESPPSIKLNKLIDGKICVSRARSDMYGIREGKVKKNVYRGQRNFMGRALLANTAEYIAAQRNYQGDQLDSEAATISRNTQQQHPTTLHPDTPSLYVDAALDHKNGLTGTGFIFKLGYQTVLASHCRPLPGAVSPIFAEGQALLQSLLWCLDSQLSPKFVFSDCLNLVSKVNSAWQDNSALSSLVSQIRLLFSNFLMLLCIFSLVSLIWTPMALQKKPPGREKIARGD
ncbi:hypothetical protein G4B88_021468, partial [Cannabis sativa]